jgi:Protein of unknown function (DUF3106)
MSHRSSQKRKPLCTSAFTLALMLGLPLLGTAPKVHAQGNLVALAQPLWSQLSATQRETLSPFEKQWNGLPVKEKRAWVKLADDFPKMQPTQQARARKRMLEWANLTASQRKLARDNFRLAKAVPSQEQQREFENYQSMSVEQRRVLRSAGSTSNTAAVHAGAATGLAKEAAQPLPAIRPGRPAQAVQGAGALPLGQAAGIPTANPTIR